MQPCEPVAVDRNLRQGTAPAMPPVVFDQSPMQRFVGDFLQLGIQGRSNGQPAFVEALLAEAVPTPLSIVGEMAMRSRSEEHTSELQSLMRISYAVFCLKKNI